MKPTCDRKYRVDPAIDFPSDRPMPTSDIPSDADRTAEFERELTELIATAFARGTTVERTWEITVPVTAAPNWTVEISKTYSDEESPYEPDFIDDRRHSRTD